MKIELGDPTFWHFLGDHGYEETKHSSYDSIILSNLGFLILSHHDVEISREARTDMSSVKCQVDRVVVDGIT